MKIKLFVTLLLLGFTSAQAESEFSELGYTGIDDVFDLYMSYDDKAGADESIDNWIDGFVSGILATYNYQAGMSLAIRQCLSDADRTPADIRKALLRMGAEDLFEGLATSTFVYAYVHMLCAHVLGEYETIPEEGESS